MNIDIKSDDELDRILKAYRYDATWENPIPYSRLTTRQVKAKIESYVNKRIEEAVNEALKKHQNCITPKSWKDSDPS